MKKILFCLAFASAPFAFNSCEDVEDPYVVDSTENEGGNTDDAIKNLPYEENFASSLGDFKNYTTSGAGAWIIDYSTAKASGYDNTSKVTTAGTYYLVSPEISLADVTAAHLTFDYILRYNRGDENQQLFISDAFNAEAPTEGWVALPLELTEGSDWNTFYAADVQIPEEYLGKTIRIAFYYNTNATSGSTWEVKNFAIQEGNASEGGGEDGGEDTPDTPDTPVTGDNIIANGDFEGWTGGLPNHWKTASSAGNATLSQSTDAHGGSYSVCVGGDTKNKRIGYKELTLKAGTYKMAFYTKTATADGGSVCPGYAQIKDDGSLVYNYKKQGTSMVYTDDLNTTDWVQVEHTFTLSEQQKVSFIVMNQKKTPGIDVLIDDFTVTTADGGIVEGEDGGEETPDTPVTEGYFSETFASSLGAFTIENKNLPSDLSYVWNHSTYNGQGFAKASAYKGKAYAAESWLISPSIDLTNASTATLNFSHAGNYVVDAENELYVKIKEEGGEWQTLTVNQWFESSKSYPFADVTIDINAYAGKKVQIAFVYTSTDSNAGTWEVKNVVVK